MAGSRKLRNLWWVLPVLSMFTGEAVAAVCTSVSTGRWDQAARWDCGRVPLSTDTVVIAHNNVQMRGNETVAGLTINAGAVLDDAGNRLSSTGDVVINGTFGVNGGGGDLRMATSGTTISGNGNIDDARLQIDGNITLSAGSVLNFMNGADIRVGSNAVSTFTIDGAITAVGIQAGSRLLRVDNNNASTVVINGSIDAPTANIEIQRNGTIQNNGSVTIAFLDGNGDTNVTWTQGANSTLTLSQPAQGWNNGTFTANAVGNTVIFNGTATPFDPATYYNVGGTNFTCPHSATITVAGSTPCGPGAPTVTTATATAMTTVDATLNGTVSSNQAVTTVNFQYGLTGAYGMTVAAAQSPLAANAVGTPVSAAITGLTCGTLYHFRAVGTNTYGTTNGADLTFTTSACPPAPGVVSINTASTNPTAANTVVTWAVTFNTSVTGVDLGDFTLTSTGGVVGATLTSISGTGANYTVTANTGTGTVGTLTLRVVDNDSIIDGTTMPLGGVGAGNGNFTGQAYTLVLPTCTPGLLFCDDFERTVVVGGANAATSVGTAPGYGAWTVSGLNGGALGTICNGIVGNQGCAGIDSDIPPFNVVTNPRANATKSLYTRWSAVTVTSPVINLAGKGGARLSFWLRRGSDCFSEWPSNNTWHTFARCGQVIPNFTPTAGEEFQVQYLNNVGAWVVIAQYPMDDAPGQIFVPVIGLPEDALHANFQFRFAQPGGSGSNATTGGAPGVRGYDYWHVDNVVLEEVPSVSFSGPFCDTFEGDLSRWDMAGTGNVRIGSTWFQNGIHGMDLRWNTVSATTRATDLSVDSGNNLITFWVKRGTGVMTQVPNGTGSEYPDTVAKGLKVEYLNNLGAWVQLGTTFPGAGTQGQVFDPVGTPATNSFAIPANAKHANFRLRISMLAGSGLFDQDYWHVDDVCVGSSVGATDLSMTMSSAGVFSPGQYVTYTMTVTNNGPNSDPGPITITDTLPVGLTFVGGSAGWACSAAGQDVTCTQTGALANLASTTLTITATVDAGASGSITNTATVGGQTNDISQANNTATKTDTLFVPGYVFTDKACAMDGTAVGVGAQCSEIAWNPQTAGTPQTNVYITAVNAAMVPTQLHGTNPTTVSMQFGLSCHDPVANAGVQATFYDGATTKVLPLCTSNGAVPASWSTAWAMSFPAATASVGPFNFNYNDVGAVELFVRNNAVTTQVGSSGKFVVKPAGFSFVFENAAGTLTNPSAADATGAAFVKAGEAFKATISAVTAGGAVTPNFGNEVTRELIGLSHALAPGLGLVNAGTLTGTLGAPVNGVATADGVSLLADGVTTSAMLAWSEVGILQFTASFADGNYNPGGFVGPYPVSAVSGNVGRFYPDHFDTVVTAPMDCTGLTLVCPDNGLVYSGQALPVSVEARNANDQVTQNYRYSATASQNFARAAVLSAVDAVNSGTAVAGGNLSVTAVAASAFSNGTANAVPVFTFAAVPSAPTDAYISAIESGGDGVTSTAHEQGTKVVSGRIKVGNAYGSEKLPLTVPVTIQYWDGARWVLSSTDGVTQVNTNLSTAGGNLVAGIVSGLGSGVSVSGAGLKTVANGQLQNFTLNRPNVSGVVDLSFNAPIWLSLQAGQVTFGIYKGGKEFIYLREAY
ncbi:MAG: DUF11 domain-containing protein [Gammaproteobacteria bacterium]|nr:DUF11 domain-containing protein [Sideroxydans sp.]MBU3903826.1 DUF11 domain-containing protein [Gammaproteobacteria bacterium]MBU4046337.1 DUF11 domain-containing protein [Gammaproteobacteria bacterium]